MADSGSFEGRCFSWSAALGKILTLDNLRRRRVVVMNKCCMCKRNGKFVDHLVHCDVSSAIWNFILFIYFF
jgi:hypothetical protein